MDIVSLDIQRSRDHGIPSYTQFRKYCGLKDIQNVQDLAQIMVKGVSLHITVNYMICNFINYVVCNCVLTNNCFPYVVFSRLTSY